MENIRTEEQIVKSISAAHDSLNLIDSLNAQSSLTDEDKDTVARNVEHIKIMLGYEWFTAALTKEDKALFEKVK